MKIRIIKNCDVKLYGSLKTIKAGALMDLPDDKAQRLIHAGYAELYTYSGDGRELPHFCVDGNCHCSEKLPGANYPAGCTKCDSYYASQDAPQTATETQNTYELHKRRSSHECTKEAQDHRYEKARSDRS